MHDFARNQRLKWIYFLWFGTIFVCAIACVCPDKRVSSVRDWRGGGAGEGLCVLWRRGEGKKKNYFYRYLVKFIITNFFTGI